MRREDTEMACLRALSASLLIIGAVATFAIIHKNLHGGPRGCRALQAVLTSVGAPGCATAARTATDR